MAAVSSIGIARISSLVNSKSITKASPSSPSRLKISCVQWDPEGVFKSPPQTGHIAKLQFKQRLEKDAEYRDAFEKQMREEKERRQALRESREIPDTAAELIEYLLDTEAQEIEYEIARLRPRLNEEFFSQIKLELGKLRFAVSRTQDMEDRLIELEALEKALLEATEAYDKMQADLVKARESLTKLLTSRDKKATVCVMFILFLNKISFIYRDFTTCRTWSKEFLQLNTTGYVSVVQLLEMVEANEVNRSLLALLDENIAGAQQSNQKQAAEFMEKLRLAVLKYVTV